jgi:eukaryotic-like serine/threonine-protein kinase
VVNHAAESLRQKSGAVMAHKLSRSRCRPEAGQRFVAAGEKYEFRGKLGNGAVGLVRKAQHLASGRTVAVKILAPDPKYIDVAAFDDVAQRFRREGIRGSQLRDDNLVEIIAYEENADGSGFEREKIRNPFIVMEYVQGRTLESFIKNLEASSASRGTNVTAQTVSIAKSVASALRYLHDRKIIHRDVKPANIFLSKVDEFHIPSFVKLGDFGVTKWGDFLASTTSGTLTVTKQQGLGTLKYMSPEQAVRPRDVTVRSDMFSLGITLFELFTGRILDSPHHVFEIMSARTGRQSIMGKLLGLGVPARYEEADLFELVLDMFLVSPKNRPSSMTVAGRMERLLERIGDLRTE